MRVPIWMIRMCATALYCALPAMAGDILMRVAIDANGEKSLTVSRTTETRVVPMWPHGDTSDRLYDTVNLWIVTASAAPVHVWTKSHAPLDYMYRRCSRLVFYDAIHDEEAAWVLYSLDCSAYVDRIVRDEQGGYRVVETVHVLDLSDSGVKPYLMDTGIVFHLDDALHIGFKMPESTSRLHGRDHPYAFWRIESGSALEIDRVADLNELKLTRSHALDADNRPRFVEQIVGCSNPGAESQ